MPEIVLLLKYYLSWYNIDDIDQQHFHVYAFEPVSVLDCIPII